MISWANFDFLVLWADLHQPIDKKKCEGFLFQFVINLHSWVFQKVEITLYEAARAISAFWKPAQAN